VKKMDIYSLGLLFLWFCFQGETIHCESLSDTDINVAFSGQAQNQAAERLQILKKEDRLLDCALRLVSQMAETTDQTRECLQKVFRLSLPGNPEERAPDMQPFVDLLCNQELLQCVHDELS
jgi:hypothetical protein